MSPRIRVVAHGGLPCHAAGGPGDDEIVVEPGDTLADVLRACGIDRGLVGVASVDGRHIEPEAVLTDDAVIDIYPVFGGG